MPAEQYGPVQDTDCLRHYLLSRSTTSPELMSMTMYCGTQAGFLAHTEFFGTSSLLPAFHFYKVSLGISVLQSKHRCNESTDALFHMHHTMCTR